MERDRPPDKRRRSTRLSGEYHRVARNDKPIMEEQERQVHKDIPQVEQQHTITRGSKDIIYLTGLNGDNDFIRRWLAQTENGPTQDLGIPSMHQRRSKDEEKVQLAHVDIPSRHTGLESEATNETFPNRGRRRHNSSSDSSLLEPPTRPKSQQLVKEVSRRAAFDRQEDGSTPPRKKQRIATSDSGIPSPSSVSSNAVQQSFEKRARHKTLEDRYEPKTKDTKSKKARGGKSSKKKREKSSQKKAGRKSGADLVHNFSSKSIGQDRLTIRPSNGPGLFKNGRASSPARRRGLPDLAFSEMEFLQHSSRYQPPPKEDRIKSKARKKEKRKTSRAQEEISDFFKPKVPLKQIETYNAGSSSLYMSNEYFKHKRESDQIRPEHSGRRSQSLDHPEKPYLSFGKPRPSSDRRSTSRGLSPAISYPRNIPNSDSRLSGKATTSVSWSESQTSSQGTGRRLANLDRRDTSPTPESIRRSIEETRIFQNTGIRIADSKQPRAAPMKELLEGQVNRSEASEPSTSTAAPSIQSSGIHPELASRNPEQHMSRAILRPHSVKQSTELHRDSNARGNVSNQNDPTLRKRSNGPIIENFDPQSGWHPQASSTGPSRPTLTNRMTTEVPQQSMSAPIDRVQLARRARIKRPSTTLLLIRQAVGDQALEERACIVGDKHEAKVPAEAHSGKDAIQGSSSRELAEAACLSKSTGPDGIGGDLSNQGSSQRQPNGQIGTKAQVVTRNDLNDESRKSNISTGDEGTRLLSVSRPSNIGPHIAVPHPAEQHSAQGLGNFSFLGLPVRGSRINSGQPRPLQATRFSPLVEVEPLFIRQISQQPLREPNFHCGDEPIMTGVDEIQNSTSNNGVDFVEDYYYGITDEDQYGNFGQREEFLFLKSYEEAKNSETGDLNESNLWNLGSHPVDNDGENYDLIYDNGEEVYEQREIAGGGYGVDDSVQIYGQAEPHAGDELYNFGGHSGMQGFWRPRQRY